MSGSARPSTHPSVRYCCSAFIEQPKIPQECLSYFNVVGVLGEATMAPFYVYGGEIACRHEHALRLCHFLSACTTPTLDTPRSGCESGRRREAGRVG